MALYVPLYAPPFFNKRSLTKTLRIMRLTAFFLLAACLQVSARGLAQTVTLSVKGVPLSQPGHHQTQARPCVATRGYRSPPTSARKNRSSWDGI